jgi:putative redox protein
MNAKITWTQGRQYVAESESGHALVLDTGKDFGGQDTGPRPMELLLMGTAGCTAVDVQYILADRMHETVDALTVRAEAQRADEHPKVFTKLHLHYAVRGRSIKEKNLVRAITLSMTTYCSASTMIKKSAAVTATYTLTDNETGESVEGTVAY